MDILCPVCREPWDNDSLHEEADDSGRSYAAVAADFRTRGCLALEVYGTPHNPETVASPVIAEVYDLLGDDMDGAAAMLEDAEALGYL